MNEYLYAYSMNLSAYLRSKGFRYICVGLNERSGGKFHLYAKTAELKAALDAYDAEKGVI